MRYSIRAKRPSVASPGILIVASVPRNHSRSPSPGPDHVGAVATVASLLRLRLEQRAVEQVDVVDETLDGVAPPDVLLAGSAHPLAQLGIAGEPGQALRQLVGRARLHEKAVLAVSHYVRQ